jgi:peptide deformylase
MIRPVIKRGDPRLELPSQEITDIGQAREIITDLCDTLIAIQGLYNFSRGSGIAAPQIGEPWQVDVMQFDGRWFYLVNPKIIAHSDEKELVPEGCLSFFDYRGKALRYADVTVESGDENGNQFTFSSGGDLNFSSLIQHELDHLGGELYTAAMPPGEQLVHHADKPFIP